MLPVYNINEFSSLSVFLSAWKGKNLWITELYSDIHFHLLATGAVETDAAENSSDFMNDGTAWSESACLQYNKSKNNIKYKLGKGQKSS